MSEFARVGVIAVCASVVASVGCDGGKLIRNELLNLWLKLVLASGRFKAVEGQVVVLEGMTARDHVESDPLDLDYLSTSAKG